MKMKTLNKIFAVVVLFIVASCANSEFYDLNVDPNEPVAVPAENLLTQGQFSVAYNYWDRTVNFEFGMLMVQHLAQNEYTEEQRYDFNLTDFNAPWAMIYAGGYTPDWDGGLADLNNARALVEADETLTDAVRANQVAVIDILMTFAFQYITDSWGDVPYSQTFQPEDFEFPAYDSQQSIYQGMINTVQSAVNSIDTSAPGFTSGDVIYGGNMDAWQKFGNALLLRLGMRIADRDATLAASTVSSALGGNIMSSVADQAMFQFQTNQAIANPFYEDAVVNNRDDFRVTEILVNTMQSMNDPRLPMYADQTTTGDYVGIPYGLQDGPATELKFTTSNFNASIREATAPAYFLKYSEVKFFEAEAIERGFVSGDAQAAFNEAVTASMNEWGITDATTISDYLTANPYDAANWRQSIGLQKWLALFTNGLEAWFEHRRLDAPALPFPAAAVPGVTAIPTRMLYPASEQSANEESLSAVPGENSLNAKVWWDVN